VSFYHAGILAQEFLFFKLFSGFGEVLDKKIQRTMPNRIDELFDKPDMQGKRVGEKAIWIPLSACRRQIQGTMFLVQ